MTSQIHVCLQSRARDWSEHVSKCFDQVYLFLWEWGLAARNCAEESEAWKEEGGHLRSPGAVEAAVIVVVGEAWW